MGDKHKKTEENLPEPMSQTNLDSRKQHMVEQLRVLSAKIENTSNHGGIPAARLVVEDILNELGAPTLDMEVGENEKQKLGISLLESLSNVLHANLPRLFKQSDYLDILVTFGARALRLLPKGYHEVAGWQFNLGKAYQLRYSISRAMGDINRSIEHLNQALATTPPDHPKTIMRLDFLGRAYNNRCQHLPKLDIINDAIEGYSSAISHVIKGDEGGMTVPLVLNHLGQFYLLRSYLNHEGDLEDIDKAKEYYSRAEQLAQGSLEYPTYLYNLGHSYHLRFKRLGQSDDINAAINTQTKALQFTRANDSALCLRLNGLGDTYQTRFAFRQNVQDINEAIRLQEEAVSLSHKGDPNMASYMSSLGDSYMERFNYHGGKQDISRAIEYQRRAVLLTSRDDKNLLGRLNNLGISYRSRFNHLGELDDIDKAIEYQGVAAQLALKAGREQSAVLFNLGDSYQIRYSRLYAQADLENAIGFQTQATNFTPDDHPNKPNQLDNLGSSYALRFTLKTLIQSLDDINRAIEYQTHAVRLAMAKHGKLHTFLNNLGISYQTRFLNDDPGSREDINEAIDCISQAIDLTPDKHTDKPSWLTNLGNAYSQRFESFKELKDLDYAIKAHVQAISLTPQGHPLMTLMRTNLAITYLRQYEQSDNQQALDDAIGCLQKAVECVGGHPGHSFNAARLRASLLASNHRPGSIAAYQTAIDYLPGVIWLGDLTATTYYHISQINDFFSEAAANAIRGQEYYRALEWIEEGRSIVWRQLLQLKAPLDSLAAVDTELAKGLERVADELHATISESAAAETSESYLTSQNFNITAASRHHRLVYRYNDLMDQARKRPGFSEFMRPKPGPELAKCAQSGPVVVVNVHRSRCDALILLPGQTNVAHISLPNLFRRPALKLQTQDKEHSMVSWSVDELAGYRGIRLGARRNQFETMLTDLWACVARPVLEALGYITNTPLPIDQLPQITWCTTGALSFLPLHACGDYNNPRIRLFNFAISSYTPTLSILFRPRTQHYAHSRMLVVGQEATDGQAPLPSTKEELDCIETLAQHPVQLTRLEGQKATVSAVKSAMEEHDWVHLACHAYQRPRDPMGSAFLLHEEQLELRQIVQKPLKNKGLAFLSACHTAAGEEPLPNESAHLASGMLIAGYSSVIATMWAIFDKDGPVVTKEVYANLIKYGRMNCEGSARALHVAISKLREEVGEKEFGRWAPFIHIGP